MYTLLQVYSSYVVILYASATSESTVSGKAITCTFPVVQVSLISCVPSLQEREAGQRREEEGRGLHRQQHLQEEGERMGEGQRSQEQEADDVAAFLAGTGGVATGAVAMDTTPPTEDASESGPTAAQHDSQTSQTSFEEPAKPVELAQPPSQDQDQWQWPQEGSQDPEQPQSLRLTATNPELAQVLPPAVAGTTPFTGYSSAESANSSSVAPSAPPPTYDQIAAGQGSYDGGTGAGQPLGGGVPGGYDPTYQMQAPPPGSAYYPSYSSPAADPYKYQYGAPPPPAGGPAPQYGQQFSNPAASPQSYASTANWGSFDTTSGSSDVPSQQESNVPYVDRSTKPSSLSALSTGWGGESPCGNCCV